MNKKVKVHEIPKIKHEFIMAHAIFLDNQELVANLNGQAAIFVSYDQASDYRAKISPDTDNTLTIRPVRIET
jgi:esterase/lipase superfamily enzyme